MIKTSIFSQILPESVTLDSVTNPRVPITPGGTDLPEDISEPSYFDITIGGDTSLSGIFDGYCVDTDTFFTRGNGINAKVYSSYDIPNELTGAPFLEKPDNFDLVNWIINQNFVGQTASNGQNFTYGDVQRAIWQLTDDNQAEGGLGPYTQAKASEIVQLAENNGEGFIPSYEYTTIFGEEVTGKLAVILAPDSTNDGVDNPDRQIMIIEVELAKLGDFVFNDLNADGIQDANEPGIGGVTVNLLADVDGNGTIEDSEVIDSTTTDVNGGYDFEVIAGEYKVQFEKPEGFEVSPANQGTDDAVDSDGLISDVVSLSPGEDDPTIDQGFYKSVQGIKIEKFVNGIDVSDLNHLPEIAVGEDVIFTYNVTNTGNFAFTLDEVIVSDDNGTANNTTDDFTPILLASSDIGSDGILSAGETWLYTSVIEEAQDLTTTTTAQDIRFNLTGSSSTTGDSGNIRSFTQDGVSVEVSGFSYNSHEGWQDAYVGSYDGGLGVINRNHDSDHRVDNYGSLDYLLFEFDQDVTVDKAFLDAVGHDSDISIWIGDRNGTDISNFDDDLLDSFVKENDFTNHGGDRWANLNHDELAGDTLVISAYTDGSNDSFKLKKLDISVAGEETIGVYQNTATVTAGDVSDSDTSGYINPETTPTPTPTPVPEPSECIETTLTFTGGSSLDGSDGNVRTFSQDGLSVDVRGFSRGKDELTGQWKDAYVGVYGSGLGVTDQDEGTHAHRVDNLGHNFNYVMFKFSQEVTVDKARFNAVVDDSDAKFWIGNTNETSLNDDLLASFYSEINDTPGTGEYDPRWANINSSGLSGNTLVIAANPDEHTFEDSFKIHQLEVCYV